MQINSNNSFNGYDIPQEVEYHIFSQLPYNNLSAIFCVSHRFMAFSQNPAFLADVYFNNPKNHFSLEKAEKLTAICGNFVNRFDFSYIQDLKDDKTSLYLKKIFESCPNIKRIDFYKTFKPLHFLTTNLNITTLNFDSCHDLSDETFMKALSLCPSVEVLSIRSYSKHLNVKLKESTIINTALKCLKLKILDLRASNKSINPSEKIKLLDLLPSQFLKLKTLRPDLKVLENKISNDFDQINFKAKMLNSGLQDLLIT